MTTPLAASRPRSAVVPPEADSGGARYVRSTVESLVILLVLMAVEQLFFGPQHFAQLSVHPFWIVVLIASVQNGLFAGVTATVLSALLMDWPARPIGADITEHYLSIAILPLQWLVVSLLVGLFRQGQIRTERRLAAENRRLTEMSEALAAEVVRLDRIVADLELAAVTAPVEAAASPPPPQVELPRRRRLEARRG